MYRFYKFQRQSHISSAKNTTACAVGPFYWALELRAEWEQNDQLIALELSKGFILPAFETTVPAPTIPLKRLRIHLKGVLNSIVGPLPPRATSKTWATGMLLPQCMDHIVQYNRRWLIRPKKWKNHDGCLACFKRKSNICLPLLQCKPRVAQCFIILSPIFVQNWCSGSPKQQKKASWHFWFARWPAGALTCTQTTTWTPGHIIDIPSKSNQSSS